VPSKNNEKRIDAVAVTVVEIRITSAGPGGRIHFTVHRPLLFVIMEKQPKSIIFISRVMLPEYES
jgi:serine protease inhibitor